MALAKDEKVYILKDLGATAQEMEKLLEYTTNVFSYDNAYKNEKHLLRWYPLLAVVDEMGAAYAINKYLVREDLIIEFISPEEVKLEMVCSFAGKVPIISTKKDEDFESLVQNIVFKDKPYPYLKAQGAQFVFGKNNYFIILSHKPYSNTSAKALGLEEGFWREKSYDIRKYHECTHLYTRKYFGSARNNLHDELVADFSGMWAAFSYYRADWFMEFLAQGRMSIYVEGLSRESITVIERLAYCATTWIEKWSKCEEFSKLSDVERIDFLCKKELLSYVY